MRMLSRRTILRAAASAAPGVLSGRLSAAPLRKVKLTLPWVAEGSNAYAFVAKAHGYWADAGLDVEISRGYGSVAAAQAVGAAQFDFGLAAASAGIQQAAKGLPLISLACCGYDATMTIAVLGDSPILTPKDLEGKSLGGTVNSGEYPFLPAYAKAAGFDLAKVKLVQIDPNVSQRVLMEKQVDAVCGFATSIAPVLAANNVPVRFMTYNKVDVAACAQHRGSRLLRFERASGRGHIGRTQDGGREIVGNRRGMRAGDRHRRRKAKADFVGSLKR
jgi:NitT/TauT family transport system substrate-binding protein